MMGAGGLPCFQQTGLVTALIKPSKGLITCLLTSICGISFAGNLFSSSLLAPAQPSTSIHAHALHANHTHTHTRLYLGLTHNSYLRPRILKKASLGPPTQITKR